MKIKSILKLNLKKSLILVFVLIINGALSFYLRKKVYIFCSYAGKPGLLLNDCGLHLEWKVFQITKYLLYVLIIYAIISTIYTFVLSLKNKPKSN